MSVVTRIRTSQELTVPFTRAEVWAVLADVDAYPEWWPAKLRVQVIHYTGELLGAEFEVRPLLGRMFRIRFEELEGKTTMRLRFFGGSLEGPGGFHLHAHDGATEVRYEMDVFARGLDVAVLSTVVPFDRIHRSRMRSVLNSLAARLKTLHKGAEREAAQSTRDLAREHAQRQAETEAAARRASAAAEEAARLAREEAAKKRAEREALALAAAEEARRRAETEAARRALEEAAKKRLEEEARQGAENEAAARAAAEEAARRAAEQEAARLALEAAERKRAQEEALALAAAEEARKRAEEEAAARAAAEEAARRAAEEEAARLALEEAERKRAEEEALALAAAEEARKRAEEEAAARAAAEEAARRAAEEEAARLALEAAERKRAEEKALAHAAAEEARKRAEEEAAARAAAEEAARRAAEEEAARLALEAAERKRAEDEALALAAAEEARKRAEDEAAARRAEALARIDTAERQRLAAEEAAIRAAAEASRVYVSGDVDHATSAEQRDTGARPRPLWSRLASWLHEAPAPPTSAPVAESMGRPASEAPESNFEIARRYLVALSANASSDQIGDFLAAEVTEEEFSHRFRTTAVRRGRDGMLEARARTLSRFSSQRYQLAGATGGGSLVAMEVRWRGTVAATGDGFLEGQEFDARMAMLLKFADGKIVRQRLYPCFEIWSTKAERAMILDERVTQAGQRAATSTAQSPISQEAQGSNFEISRRYLEALGTRADADTIAHFFAQDAVQDEFPNRVVPAGVQRDLLAIRLARTRDLALLTSQHYELIGATGGGSQVALETVWSGVAGESQGAGDAAESLEARLGIFLTFRNGLIVSQRNYGCPSPNASEVSVTR